MTMTATQVRTGMQVGVEVAALARALDQVRAAVPTRPWLPVIGGVRLVADGDALTVTGTDVDLRVQVRVPAVTIEPGVAVVDYAMAAKAVKSLRGKGRQEQVVLAVREGLLHLDGGRFTHELVTMEPEDFPVDPAPTVVQNTWANAAELAAALGQVLVAVAKDETRPVLTAVCVDLGFDRAELAATDSYRLAMRTLRVRSTGQAAAQYSVLLPARAATLVAKLAAKADGQVHIERSASGLRFAFVTATASVVISTRLVDGEFPRYHALIPDLQGGVVVARAGLAEALAHLAPYTTGNNPVELEFGTEDGVDQLRLAARKQDVGGGSVTVVTTGSERAKLAVNAAYLSAGITALGTLSEDIVWQLAASQPDRKPMLLRVAGRTDLRYLLMPVRLPS